MATVRVSSHSRPGQVAGAIAHVIRLERRAEVQAIGAPVVLRAVEAVIIARAYLERDGLDVTFVPVFVSVDRNGQACTAIKLCIECRSLVQETKNNVALQRMKPARA